MEGDKGKDKGKGILVDEEDTPPQKHVGESSTSTSETETEIETEVPTSWDWRDYPGVIGSVIDQMYQATCWAVALVRAVQALLNIGISMTQQKDLSIQHIVNHVKFDPEQGISSIKKALRFMETTGVCLESQCRHYRQLVRRNCPHPREINRYTVDSFEFETDLDDVAIVPLVWRQPVMAIMPFNRDLVNYNYHRNWLYNHDRREDGPTPELHNVLIVGFGDHNGRPYWIVQNSWGEGWGDGGYFYVYRQTVEGRSISQFSAIIYPNKRGHPHTP